jgi:hypothetical protein
MLLWLKRQRTQQQASVEARVSFGPCIFCGEQIAESSQDPVHLTAQTANSKPVTWFSHAKCIAQRIHPSMPAAFVEPERTQWLA